MKWKVIRDLNSNGKTIAKGKVIEQIKTMDTTKFKSVTISIDTWNRLHKIAAKDMRSVSRTMNI